MPKVDAKAAMRTPLVSLKRDRNWSTELGRSGFEKTLWEGAEGKRSANKIKGEMRGQN